MKRIIILAAVSLLGVAAVARAAELPFNGFLEYSLGSRIVGDDTASGGILLHETRFQVDIIHDTDSGSLQFRADFLLDTVMAASLTDIREAYVLLMPSGNLDLKVGRQILTWGTGDFVFLNDLFPKDWQSFFIGRDDEYLKKPASAVRATWFGDSLNLDFVWMPVFEPDSFISGERISYWDFRQNRKAGPADGIIDPVEPDKTVANSQAAARLFGNLGNWEAAFYGFDGNYGQPKGYDTVLSKFNYPRLQTWGASLRGSLLGGIGNAEAARYRSLDDSDSNDPNIVNPEYRVLVGFSRSVGRNQTLGVQTYLEHALKFPDIGRTEQDRLWITLRYTGLFMQQNLTLSWFSFYSPNEKDAYIRPTASYKFSDEVLTTFGANVFLGETENTFFGQFKDNSNVYARVRYSF